MPRLPTDPASHRRPNRRRRRALPAAGRPRRCISSETHRVGLARAPDAPALTAQTKRAAGVWKAARLSPAERTLGTHGAYYPRRSEAKRGWGITPLGAPGPRGWLTARADSEKMSTHRHGTYPRRRGMSGYGWGWTRIGVRGTVVVARYKENRFSSGKNNSRAPTTTVRRLLRRVLPQVGGP